MLQQQQLDRTPENEEIVYEKVTLSREEIEEDEDGEMIMAVPVNMLFKDVERKQGIITDKNAMKNLIDCIKTNRTFWRRDKLEKDKRYKQIIPYVVYRNEDKIFLMRRRADTGEKMLRGKYSLGIGGHMRKSDLEYTEEYEDILNNPVSIKFPEGDDMKTFNNVIRWSLREFDEEVNVHSEDCTCQKDPTKPRTPVNIKTSFMGIINDDSNELSKVHLGLVIMFDGDTSRIGVNIDEKEHDMGFMTTMDVIKLYYYENMESWSKMLTDHLIDTKTQGVKVQEG